MCAFGSEADMHGRVASLVSTRSGHFKRVDQTTDAMRTRASLRAR